LNDEHCAALATILENRPIPAIHGVVRWRIIDLCQWIFEEFRIAVSQQTLSRCCARLDSQAFGSPSPSRPGRRRNRGFYKVRKF
jgi:hypothetical protein